MPDLGYSTSDYHHSKPLAMTKTYSTRHFPQPKARGHGRHISRFTVISNAAETEQSYDPFKASRPQHLDALQAAEKTKVTIHRTRPSDVSEIMQPANFRVELRTSVSIAGSERSRQRKALAPRGYTSYSSLASSTRSRGSAPYIRANVGHKRGVSFSHLRKQSDGHRNVSTSMTKHHSSNTEVTDDDGHSLRPVEELPSSTRYGQTKKTQVAGSQTLLTVPKFDRVSHLWTDDVHQLSSSLAQDCDDAFNRSSGVSNSEIQNRTSTTVPSFQQTQLAIPEQKPGVLQKSKPTNLDNRPLPPPPARTESVKAELTEAKNNAELRKKAGGDDSPGYLDRMVSHIDRLIQPSSPTDRRTSSAPTSTRPLASIYEAGREEDSPAGESRPDNCKEYQKRIETKNGRVASAPEARAKKRINPKDRFTRADSDVRDTIRVVQSSESPVKAPAPLTIRKKGSHGKVSPPHGNHTGGERTSAQYQAGLRQQYNKDAVTDLERIDEDQHDDFANDSNSGTIVKKKPAWFRRSARAGDDLEWRMSVGGVNYVPSQSSSSDTAQQHDEILAVPPKKKFSLGRLFRKRSSHTDMTITCELYLLLSQSLQNLDLIIDTANDNCDDNESMDDSMMDARLAAQGRRSANYSDGKARQIEPQRNWLAKLFNVKPASAYICFSTSKKRARQEIAGTLRAWKKYGIRDVQVDKERNIVFGRVAAKNCEFFPLLIYF
jgi:serine/threonine-protein kinase HSL1 (negative regulator of Swe1 kinase)